MQFRTRTRKDGSKSWALIRWEYDQTKGRSVPCTVGMVTDAQLRRASQPAELPVVSRLQAEERDELREFWRSARPPLMSESYRRALNYALYDADRVVEAIAAGAATPQAAETLWNRLDKVAGALRRARLPRPATRHRRS